MHTKRLDELTKEELIEAIRKLKSQKRYGLVWESKPEEVVEQCSLELPVLEEDTKKALINPNGRPTNFIIEGDNYHALSVLNYTHGGKIDVIYIDPPYNTGAKDWKYNNDYVDLNDHFRHSKWLSMMNHRLRLAKNLLKDDGVIILTIDDNELYTVGMLLGEIFPTFEHYVITIEHNKRGRRGKNFAKTNEWAIFLVPKGMDRIAEMETASPIGGESRNLRRTGSGSTRTERPRKFYPIWVNKLTLEVVEAGEPIPQDAPWEVEYRGDLVSIWPIDAKNREKNWHYGVERTRECIKNDQLEVREQGYGLQVYYTLRIKDSKKYKTVWTGSEYDASTYGTVLLEKILGKRGSFDFPKSIYAVMECLKPVVKNNKTALILDFFAGSGTTGHAAMLLNKMDGGSRQFILCTNNEGNIAEDVTYPRIKNVIKGVVGLEDMTDFDENLRYFRTSFVKKSKVTDDTRRRLLHKSVEMLCMKEDSFEYIVDKTSFKVFKGNNHVTGILFELEALEEFKKSLSAQSLPAHIYVFSLTNDAFEVDFADLSIEHTICPIPESILEVYRKVFGK